MAAGFARWYAEGPKDVGVQTRAVLAASVEGKAADIAAAAYHATQPDRVALAHLGDPRAVAQAAVAVAALTHADPVCGLACGGRSR